MTLVERLRRFWKEDETVLIEAANTIEVQEARIRELEGALLKSGAWKIAPCCICGYNGPGYYQPDTHECAKRAREAPKS